MQLIKLFEIQSLAIILFLSQALSKDKFIISTNSQYGKISFYSIQKTNNVVNTIKFQEEFNSNPQILLGIVLFYRDGEISNYYEFSLSTEEITQSSANICFSVATPSIISTLNVKYLAFISDEIKIRKFKVEQYDIDSMTTIGGSQGIRQKNIQYNHILDKKPNTKRNVSCFIIGFRQEFSQPIPQDQNISFFVESIGDFNENQFQLTFTTLDQYYTLKWVNINCIEFYEYDQNFEPIEFIQNIKENKYNYHIIQNSNSQLPEINEFEIQSQIHDITLTLDNIFFGYSGIDSLFHSQLYIGETGNKITSGQILNYTFYIKFGRSASSNYIYLKKLNCPMNCDYCTNISVCQRCKLKFTLDSNGQCIACIEENCLVCNSNQICQGCINDYLLYKGKCYKNQPKKTYCVSRTIEPF